MARRPGGSPRGSYDLGRRARKHAGGKGPCLDQAGQEVRARACRRRPTPPLKKYDNSNASYRCVPSGVGHGGSLRGTTGSIGVTSCGKHGEGAQPWWCGGDRRGDNPGNRTTRRGRVSGGDRGGATGRPISSFPGEATIPTESRWEAAPLGDTHYKRAPFLG